MRLETVRRTDMADHIDHPFDVSETDHLWIEMTDGVRLAARLWRPVTQTPVPAILEYIPYRKSDMVRARDERNHPFFAANGYACIRVDMRGSGDSEGHMPDMYAGAELDDARQVIEWLAAQPWCTGRVGMFGTSWGGTAALQASVDAPEPLKAVIAVCATHDRFQDDIHYMGGCVLSDTFEWGATLPAILASPPTPNAGRDWQLLWKQRLRQLDFPLQNWLCERGRGTYWRRGSVIHDARSLSVPILSVGGWSDRYSNSVMALVDARSDMVWGVVGPWGHHYPDHGSPGPAIGFQRLALGWWDHWLKPAVPKDPDWPRLRVWLRGFDPPGNALAQRAGRWIESGPAGQETVLREMSLDAMASPQGTLPLQLHHDPLVGQCAGDTGYFGRSGGLPLDQTPDDARSLVFETDPLNEDVVIYGSTRVQLSGTASGKPAPIVARLSDVDTNGVAARISYGVRNLALDENPDHTPNPASQRTFTTQLCLHSTAYRLRRGHRIRLALSSAYWPMIHAPTPAAETMLNTGALRLPVLEKQVSDLSTPLPPAQDLPANKSHVTQVSKDLERWARTNDDTVEMGWHQPRVTTAYARTDTTFGYETTMTHRLHMSKAVQETKVDHTMTYDRPDGVAEVSTTLTASTSEDGTSVKAQLTVTWNDQVFATRQWTIP